MSLVSLLKRAGIVLLLFVLLFSTSSAPIVIAQVPGEESTTTPPTGNQKPGESQRTIDEQLQTPYFSDIVSCDVGVAGVAGGSGDGYTPAAPNLKDPNILVAAIDKYIQDTNPDSPYATMGKYFVSGAMRAGINPIAILSHAQSESRLATAPDPQVLRAHNAFGRSATASQPHIPGPINAGWYMYDSWEESLDGFAAGGQKEDHATYLKEHFFGTLGYDINEFDYVGSYAPISENDTPKYIADMKELMRKFVEELAPGAYATPGTPPAPGGTSTNPDTPGPQATIVIDPGHSGSDIAGNDPATGLYDFDYANRPEITDAFEVSQKMKEQLEQGGYKVIFTKNTAEDTVSLRARANIANEANANLAISVHTDGAKSFNDFKELYVQKDGLFRGEGERKVIFNNASVAQKSQQYAEAIKKQRDSIEGGTTIITDNPFNGRAPLEPGNIPMVQLFATVPWVYSEVGSGPNNTGLTAEQKTLYARSLVEGIKNAVPANGTKVSDPCVGTNGVVQGNITQTALNLAWDTELGEARGVNKEDAKPEYQQAFQEFYLDQKGGMNDDPYSDCGVFVGVVMRASGADPEYPLRLTSTQQNYMKDSGKYEIITNPSVDDLRPGDIVNYSLGSAGHTVIYTGDTGDGYFIADASLHGHVPERGGMGSVTWILRQPNVIAARLR